MCFEMKKHTFFHVVASSANVYPIKPLHDAYRINKILSRSIDQVNVRTDKVWALTGNDVDLSESEGKKV